MMHILTSLLISPGIMIATWVTMAVLFNRKNHQHYRSMYRLLPELKYRASKLELPLSFQELKDNLGNLDSILIYGDTYDGNGQSGFLFDHEVIWFVKDNHFRFSERAYLHNSVTTWFDPYATYWMFKYRRWFKNHINQDGTINSYYTQV